MLEWRKKERKKEERRKEERKKERKKKERRKEERKKEERKKERRKKERKKKENTQPHRYIFAALKGFDTQQNDIEYLLKLLSGKWEVWRQREKSNDKTDK